MARPSKNQNSLEGKFWIFFLRCITQYVTLHGKKTITQLTLLGVRLVTPRVKGLPIYPLEGNCKYLINFMGYYPLLVTDRLQIGFI